MLAAQDRVGFLGNRVVCVVLRRWGSVHQAKNGEAQGEVWIEVWRC
jgi:hypothetical protein